MNNSLKFIKFFHFFYPEYYLAMNYVHLIHLEEDSGKKLWTKL